MVRRQTLGDVLVRRRQVFFITGYDQQGVRGYHRLFRRELARFMKLWPVTAAVSEPQFDDDGIGARWQVTAAGPDWSVETCYEILRWEDIVVRDMRRSLIVLLPRVLYCLLENLLNGTIVRIFRAGWRFGLFYISQIIGLVLFPTAALTAGWLAYRVAERFFDVAAPISIAAGIVIGAAALAWASHLLHRWYIFQMCAMFIWFHDWAHGRRGDYLQRVDQFAQRIVAKARAGDVDDLLVVGHSSGGAIAIPVIARALEIDADFAAAGTPVTLAALGTTLPVAALHPLGYDVREAIRRIAVEPSVVWIDFQARKDVVNFANLDMVAGLGVDAGPRQTNPRYWRVPFREVVSPQFYARLRWNFHRMHFQFIMANDRRATYDYFMFVCGPIRLSDWQKDPGGSLARLSRDATHASVPEPAGVAQ